jgi:hypothetical protein
MHLPCLMRQVVHIRQIIDWSHDMQGSGLPQRLQFALQAFVLYPLVLPVVELGFKGAEGDHQECRAAAHEARETVYDIQQRLAEQLAKLLSESCRMDPEDIARMLTSADGRRRLEAAIDSGKPCHVPPSPPQVSQEPQHPKSDKSSNMWHQHREDVDFIQSCKKLVRRLGDKGHAGEAGLEMSIRLLSSLDDVVRKAWEPRIRAVLTSPCAMAGTAGMWWAMLGHELAALCNFSACPWPFLFKRNSTAESFAGCWLMKDFWHTGVHGCWQRRTGTPADIRQQAKHRNRDAHCCWQLLHHSLIDARIY